MKQNKLIAFVGAGLVIVTVVAIAIWATTTTKASTLNQYTSEPNTQQTNTTTLSNTATLAPLTALPPTQSTKPETYTADQPFITTAGSKSWMEKDAGRVVFTLNGRRAYYQIYTTPESLSKVSSACQNADVTTLRSRVDPSGTMNPVNKLFDAYFLFSGESNSVLDEIAAVLAPFESQLFDAGSSELLASRVVISTPPERFDELIIRDIAAYTYSNDKYLDLLIWVPALCKESVNYGDIFLAKLNALTNDDETWLNVAFKYEMATKKVCIKIYDLAAESAWKLHPTCQLD